MHLISLNFASAARLLVRPALLLVSILLVPYSSASAFEFQDVAERAKKLAATAYKKPEKNIPSEVESLNYDQYRDIRFKPDKRRWSEGKSNFELAFFHQGMLFDSPVKINEVVGKRARPIKFDPQLFDYGQNKLDPKKMEGLGYAGFRVHYPINTAKYKDEVLVFLGASYFRAVGKEQLYGLSARGIAIDTALPTGEEFPRFVEFWIERPSPAAKELLIYALLDSPRMTGAYRFILKPGAETSMDVKAQIYLRDKVTKLGIAPLTSMYFFGENQRSTTEDYRPEVHDSDGLSIRSSSGEWIWRPLVNPKRLLNTSFALNNPLGFGLMQRDRQFSSYEDLEARYEARPSAWVEPKGNWGAGRVELIQIPTPNETNDNIVAFWIPDAMPRIGAPNDFEYAVHWQKQSETPEQLAWVTQTRRGHGYTAKPDDSIALSIDFAPAPDKKLKAEDKVEASLTADGNGKILETNLFKNEVTGGWRATLRLRRLDEKKAVELRGFLRNNNGPISETWSYILPAE